MRAMQTDGFRIERADATGYVKPQSIGSKQPDVIGFRTADGLYAFGEAKTGAMVTTWIITDVYGDGCNWPGTLVPVTDRASLVAALVAQKGHDHSSPVDTTIGGLPATKIVLTLDSAFPISTCPVTIRGERLWPDPGPDENGGWMIFPGQTLTLYALDSHGKAMVLFTVVHKDTPGADVTQLQQILNSVHFLPTG